MPDATELVAPAYPGGEGSNVRAPEGAAEALLVVLDLLRVYGELARERPAA